MQNRSALFAQQSRNLLMFLVVAGYIVTYINASRGSMHYSAAQVVIGVLCGVVYLIMGMFDQELLRSFPENTRQILYFSIQCLLTLGIGWMLGPGGNWLIGLPLASLAVERLSPRWRWLVYLGILAATILPILHYSTWDTALMNALFISPGIFFVAMVTQVRINEQHAREKAENLTRQLEFANRQLAAFAAQAEELAATQERNRLAREIHDNLGHYLTIVNVQLEAAKVTWEADPTRTLEALNKAQELAKKGLNSVRESVSALRVSPVENRPLDDAISELIEESRTAGVETKFTVVGEVHTVESKVALALFRVVQEGLTNVRKHASASHVDIELNFSEADTVLLTLRDDGVGAADTSGGFGLIGLCERIHLLGGEFKVHTQPDRGFEIEVTLPFVKEKIA
jgi:signal transduction histidine kinase